MYTGSGLIGVGGGVTLAGLALATTGTQGGGVVGLLVVVVAVLLGYRAWRVRRATRTESG